MATGLSRFSTTFEFFQFSTSKTNNFRRNDFWFFFICSRGLMTLIRRKARVIRILDFGEYAPKHSPSAKICFGSHKISGVGGLNLSHHRVGSTTEIRCVHGAPSFVAPSIFRELLKNVKKFAHFLRGHSSAPGLKFKKRRLGVFLY